MEGIDVESEMRMPIVIRKLSAVVAVAVLGVMAPHVGGAQNLTYGLKPIPAIGCRIGRCVDGVWEQVCD